MSPNKPISGPCRASGVSGTLSQVVGNWPTRGQAVAASWLEALVSFDVVLRRLEARWPESPAARGSKEGRAARQKNIKALC